MTQSFRRQRPILIYQSNHTSLINKKKSESNSIILTNTDDPLNNPRSLQNTKNNSTVLPLLTKS